MAELNDIATWLAPFGIEGFKGSCSLEFDGHIVIDVERTASGDLLFSADLGALDETRAAAEMRRLLKLSYRGSGTDGCGLSLDQSGERVVLWTMVSTLGMDAAGFAARFAAFLDQADARAAELTATDMAEDGESRGDFQVMV